MSTDVTSPWAEGPVTPPRRPPGATFWLGVVVLAAGLVVAALGVRAAADSYQREQDLKRYAEASTKARYAASVGAEAVSTGQQLLALDQSDATGTPELRRLILARDSQGFNNRKQELNRESTRQTELASNLALLAVELRRALARDGPIEPRRPSPSVSP